MPNLFQFIENLEHYAVLENLFKKCVNFAFSLDFFRGYGIMYKSGLRGVAQCGSALGSGLRGRRFKSCRPDHTLHIGIYPEDVSKDM